MPALSLDSVWAKIERAKAHRDALQAHITEHFGVKENRPTISAEYDSDAGYHIFRVASVPDTLEPFLLSVSVSVGDIAHNIRSALDHLAYQLALRQARRSGQLLDAAQRRHVAFPMHSSRWRRKDRTTAKGWLDNEKAYLRFFGPHDAAVIEGFQPYRGRAGRPDSWSGPYRHQLTLLRQISNRDKHTLPNVIAAVPSRFEFSFPAGTSLPATPAALMAANAMFGSASRTTKLGAEIMRHPIKGTNTPDEVEVNGDITPTIALPKRGSVISEMDRIAAFAFVIIREFDPLA